MPNKFNTLQPIRSNEAQLARLTAMKASNDHLGNTGKGLMINDEETVALISRLATRLGLSKREGVMQCLRRFPIDDA